ncbi:MULTISPECIES: LuxR family transcriptional regulator [unclassified Pseudomonas]|uniref:LuxR family transcriptional regulator n=1 Tax=unclassified Pseudomonas TaxID=196821 RepID=UPI0025DF9C34|nr:MULTISPECIES: LuxR family transcriptional regulator [unclassified Pseudomonas]
MHFNAAPLVRPGQDPNLATLIEHLPSEIDCPFTYATIDKRTFSLSNFLSSFPLAWQHKYCGEALHRVDPIISYGVQSVAPFHWTEAYRRQPVQGQGAFEQLSREFSMQDGYTFVVHDPQQRIGLLSLVNRERNPHFHQQIQHIKATLQLALVAFHSGMNAGLTAQNAADQPLTVREHTILSWVSLGKSYSEIACICDIRVRTVKFHMANIVRKLEVDTAKQAVFAASRLGIA